MNKTYRTQWNCCRRATVAVSEIGNRIRGGCRKTAVVGVLAAGLAFSGAAEAYFCPDGGTYDSATATCTYTAKDSTLNTTWNLTEGNLLIQGGDSSSAYGIYYLAYNGGTGSIINSGSGTLSITGGSSSDAFGIRYVAYKNGSTGSLINSSTGTLSITGGSYSSANGINAVAYNGTGTIENSGSGTLSITGGSYSTAYGINYLASGSGSTGFLINSEAGTLSITGGSYSSACGIYYLAYNGGTGSIINSGSGTLSITGSSKSSAYGIRYVAYKNGSTGSLINSSTGTLSITGGSYSSANGINAVANSGTGTIENSGTGKLLITGSSKNSAYGIDYVAYDNGSTGTITNSGSGTLSITGGAYSSAYGIDYVAYNGTGTIENSGSGTLSITGGSSSSAYGIDYVAYDNGSTGTITNSGSGTLSITGGSYSSTYGIDYVAYNSGSTGTIENSGSGTLSITGGSSSDAYGIQYVANNGTGSIINSSTETLSITGGSYSSAYGIRYVAYNGTGTIENSGSGTLSITGSSKSSAYGISTVANSGTGTITNSGSGTLSITGGSYSSAYGISTVAYYSTGTIENSGSGTLSITGGSNSSAYGISTVAYYSTGTIENSGSGTLSITGGSYSTAYGINNLASGSGGTGFLINSSTGTLSITGGSKNSAYGIRYVAYNSTGSIVNSSTGTLIIKGNSSVGTYGIGYLANSSTSSGTLDNAGLLQMNAYAIAYPSNGTIINRSTGRVETESAQFFKSSEATTEVSVGPSISRFYLSGGEYQELFISGTGTVTRKEYTWLSKWTDATVTMTWEDGGTLTFTDIAPDSFAAQSITSAFQSLYGTGTTLKFTGTEKGVSNTTDADYSAYEILSGVLTDAETLLISGQGLETNGLGLNSGNLKISGGSASYGVKVAGENVLFGLGLPTAPAYNAGSGRLEISGGDTENSIGLYLYSSGYEEGWVTVSDVSELPHLTNKSSGTIALSGGSAKGAYATNFTISIDNPEGKVSIAAGSASAALSGIGSITNGSSSNHTASLSILGDKEKGIYAIDSIMDNGIFKSGIENYGVLTLNTYSFALGSYYDCFELNNYAGSELRLEVANLFSSEVEEAAAPSITFLGQTAKNAKATVAKDIIYSVKPEWKAALHFASGSTLTLTDVSENSILTELIQETFGSDLNIKYTGTQSLQTTVDAEDTGSSSGEVTISYINRLLSSTPEAVNQVADLIFAAPSSALVIGGSSDDQIQDSFGFRAVTDADIEVTGGKNFTLTGNGKTVATGKITVTDGSFTLGMNNAEVTSQGGLLQDIVIKAGKFLSVASSGLFTAKNIALETEASVMENSATLTADSISLAAGASLANSGLITTDSLSGLGKVSNSGTLKITEASTSISNHGYIEVERLHLSQSGDIVSNQGKLVAETITLDLGSEFTNSGSFSTTTLTSAGSLQNGGTLTIDTLLGSGKIQNSGNFTASVLSSFTLIENDGSISADSVNLYNSDSRMTNTGTVKTKTLSGSGLFSNSGTLIVTEKATASISNGGYMEIERIELNQSGNTVLNQGKLIAGTITLDLGTELTNRGSLTISALSGSGSVQNKGTLKITALTSSLVNAGNLSVQTVNLEAAGTVIENSKTMKAEVVTVAQGTRLTNSGTLSASSLTGEGTIQNAGLLIVAGDVSPVVQNKGTLIADSIVADEKVTISGTMILGSLFTYGSTKRASSASLILGAAARNEYFLEHLDEAQAYVEAGGTVSQAVLDALASEATASIALLDDAEDGHPVIETETDEPKADVAADESDKPDEADKAADKESAEDTNSDSETETADSDAQDQAEVDAMLETIMKAMTKTHGEVLSKEASLASDVFGRVTRRAAQLENRALFGANGVWMSPETDKSEFGGYKSERTGVSVGGQFAFNEGDTTAGAAAYYSRGKLKGYVRTNVEGFGLSVFGAQRFGAGFVAGTASLSRDTTKKSDKVGATAVSASVKAGLSLSNKAAKVSPYIGIRGAAVNADNARSVKTVQTPVGAHFVTDTRVGGWTVQPEADLSYSRQFKDRSLKLTSGDTSVFAGNHAVQAQAGLSVKRNNLTASLNYAGAAGDKGYRNHSVSVSVNYQF